MTEDEILQRYVRDAVPITDWPKWNATVREKDDRPELAATVRLFFFTHEDFPGEGWWQVEYSSGDHWFYLRSVSDYEALCILRHWTSQWLRNVYGRQPWHNRLGRAITVIAVAIVWAVLHICGYEPRTDYHNDLLTIAAVNAAARRKL